MSILLPPAPNDVGHDDGWLDDPALGVFTVSELDGLPPAVQRYFTAAIAVGTPLVTSARVRMRGRLKIRRWLPFHARGLVAPHLGLDWTSRAAVLLTGSNRYSNGVGESRWRVGRVVEVAHDTGDDISASLAGRVGAEAIWLPTALLPRFGVVWAAGPDAGTDDDGHIVAQFHVDSAPIELHLLVDDGGLVRTVWFERWGDPDGTGAAGWHRFGGEITGYRTFGGLTVPDRGRLGWHMGNHRWHEAEFLRFHVTAIDPGSRGVAHGRRGALSSAVESSIELIWIPLGAGQRTVRVSGAVFEAVAAAMGRRSRRRLLHSALVVVVDGERVVVETAPVPNGDGDARGAVGGGAVGSRLVSRWRIFRYEVRRWPGGDIPDLTSAIATRRFAVDDDTARRLLELVPATPTPVWGRDELGAGEMWNSNSVTAWLLDRCGIDASRIVPPPGSRAPGWAAGVTVSGRDLATIAAARR